ncbi:antitoxin Xre/MbcA/ParS toxin-binding domain-containing protein [Acuticoccus sediminis]|nr:antitoxin Xre/MbcA/ParS toxin-binding domain-containing protein [Acuticoccus sediminis]
MANKPTPTRSPAKASSSSRRSGKPPAGLGDNAAAVAGLTRPTTAAKGAGPKAAKVKAPVQSRAAPAPAKASRTMQPFSYAEIKNGVSGDRLAEAFRAGRLRRSDVEMVIPARTLARRLNEGQDLRLAEADAVVRLARVRAHAEEAFGDADLADTWLTAGNPELGGERPIDMARTDIGAREVEAVLTRFEHGVFG